MLGRFRRDAMSGFTLLVFRGQASGGKSFDFKSSRDHTNEISALLARIIINPLVKMDFRTYGVPV